MKDKNIKLSWIPRFSPPGSAASKKRLNKPVLILFALAIIFAILGFIDLKVNAAESDTYVSSWWSKVYVDSNGEEQVAKNDWYTYTSSSPLEVYYYQSHDDYVADTPVSFSIAVVSDSPITASGSTSSFKSTEYVFGDKTIYVCMSSSGTSFASPLSGYVEVTTDADNARRLNSSYTRDDFANAYYNNTLDLGNSYELDFVATMYIYEDSSCTTLYEGYPQIFQDYSFVSGKPISVYYYQMFSTPSGGDYTHYFYLVSQDHIYSNGVLQESGSFESNGVTYYYAAACYMSTGFSSDNPGFFELIFSGSSELYKLNSDTYKPDAYGREQFVSDIKNGVLDSEQIIDYDSLEVDDSLSTINNLLYNIIRNKKPSENDTTGLGIIKDVEYYEYLTWNNTMDLPLQVEYVPIVQVYDGLIKETFQKEFYGEWATFEILDSGTNSYTKRTDSSYLFENDPAGKEFEDEILDKYVSFGQNTYLFYGYRIRYLNFDDMKAGAWVYAVPGEDGIYYSYVEYSDGYTSDSEDITGTDNTYENLDDISGAQADIDKENAVKDEYGVTDTEISVTEVSTWLSTLVDFIKGSPPLVGSVLSFLPQPILYGMYMLIFLGIVSAGFAIIRALI